VGSFQFLSKASKVFHLELFGKRAKKQVIAKINSSEFFVFLRPSRSLNIVGALLAAPSVTADF
jgi:hypothetical protein